MSEERPIILELDCATGIQTERPMTDEEYEHYQAMQESNAVQQAALQAQLEKEQADKASARAKLAALGLTDDETEDNTNLCYTYSLSNYEFLLALFKSSLFV